MEERTLGSLLDVRDSDLVLIHDAWTGYNEHSPIAAVWDLRRTAAGDFVGQGHFSTSLAGERVIDVTVAAAKAKKFLDAVAGARVVPGPYEPLMEHTDDFPHIEILLVGHKKGETTSLYLRPSERAARAALESFGGGTAEYGGEASEATKAETLEELNNSEGFN